MPKAMFLSEDNLVQRCLYLGIRPTDSMFPAAKKLIFDRAFLGLPYSYDAIYQTLRGPDNENALDQNLPDNLKSLVQRARP